MKPRINTFTPLAGLRLRRGIIAVSAMSLFAGCGGETSTTGPSGVATSIHSYLTGLSYDPSSLMQVIANPGHSGAAPDTGSVLARPGGNTHCVSTKYSLSSNLGEIILLNPSAATIFPGALVTADNALRGGAPNLVVIDQAPITLTLDFNGSNKFVTVTHPSLAATAAAIDTARQAWLLQGHTIGARTSYSVTTDFSSQQTALDLGANVQWAGITASAAFQDTTTDSSTTVTGLYRQVFYTVTMNQPTSGAPESVFGPLATLAQVTGAFTAAAPPAWVSSVSYGRIIMVTMHSRSHQSATSAQAAFQYAAKGDTAGITASASRVLHDASTTFEAIAIGGSATATALAFTLADPSKSLAVLIAGNQGLNAQYSATNPGVPISYVVRYLQDNTVAQMGFQTNYTDNQCGFVGDLVQISLIAFSAPALPAPYGSSCGDAVSGYYLDYVFTVTDNLGHTYSNTLAHANRQQVVGANFYPGSGAWLWTSPSLGLLEQAGSGATITVTGTVTTPMNPSAGLSATGTYGVTWSPANHWSFQAGQITADSRVSEIVVPIGTTWTNPFGTSCTLHVRVLVNQV